jgi:hypothetical protein
LSGNDLSIIECLFLCIFKLVCILFNFYLKTRLENATQGKDCFWVGALVILAAAGKAEDK